MRREDLRRWVDNHRVAQRREREGTILAGPEPPVAIASALALVALAGRLHGWPMSEDAVDRQDDAAARVAWNRLRAVLLRRGGPG
jgi:hypothetical protein